MPVQTPMAGFKPLPQESNRASSSYRLLSSSPRPPPKLQVSLRSWQARQGAHCSRRYAGTTIRNNNQNCSEPLRNRGISKKFLLELSVRSPFNLCKLWTTLRRWHGAWAPRAPRKPRLPCPKPAGLALKRQLRYTRDPAPLLCSFGAAPLSDPPHICGAGLTPGQTPSAAAVSADCFPFLHRLLVRAPVCC